MIEKSKLSSNFLVVGKMDKVVNSALSIIVPTRNEAGNIDLLLTGIKHVFKGESIEVIFVDDSTDETPEVIEAAAMEFSDLKVRLIHRLPGQRTGGLGGAVVLGLRAAQSEYACVMDGDLQHPPELVPVLLKTAIRKKVDLVIATRRNEGSEVTGLNFTRDMISRGLDMIARVLFPKQLKDVSDPLTGFFLVRVDALALSLFQPKGFKILMEILVRHPDLKKGEVPFCFGERIAGRSKASATEVWRYLNLLWILRFGEGSFRFLGFALVGLSGILVNMLVLFLATDIFKIYYLLSAGIATIASTLWNFSLTDVWVYRSKSSSKSRVKRFGLFFLMNLVALSLRTPMLYVLTTVLGVYYVISNLISLAAMTVSRFLMADNFIWGQKTPALRINRPVLNMEKGNEDFVVL